MQQTSGLNLKTGSEFGVLGNWQRTGTNTHERKKKKRRKKMTPEQRLS